MTEKTSVTAPKAETPIWATPPDTLPTPRVMSLACCRNVSSEPLPPSMNAPRSLCLTVPTICGRSWLNPRTAPAIACVSTNMTAAMTITTPSTSTAAHRPRLQPHRRSIAVTTGERTATLKTETKMRRRTFAIDATAQAIATAPAISTIVRIDIEISMLRRPVPPPAREEDDPAALICPSPRLGTARLTLWRPLALAWRPTQQPEKDAGRSGSVRDRSWRRN
jgi:hypothetical protein